MEISPSVLVTLALAEIAFIAWLIRLESKTNSAIERLNRVDSHIANDGIHHNAGQFREFEKRIEDKFAAFTSSMQKVESYVEDIDKKLDHYLQQGKQ